MSHGLYLVSGHREYRGHKPGSYFEAALDPGAEQRAIRRGDIRLIKRIEVKLEPRSYRLPKDWPPGGADSRANREAPQGASST